MDAPVGPFTTALDHPAVVGEAESSSVTSGNPSASRCAPSPISNVAPALEAIDRIALLRELKILPSPAHGHRPREPGA